MTIRVFAHHARAQRGMADEREHVERGRVLVESLEIVADWKSRAAVLAHHDGGEALRHLGRC